MKLDAIQDIGNVKDWEQLKRFSQRIYEQISDILNGGATFGDNMSASIQALTFDAANKESVLKHNLGRVPIGFITISKSVDMNLFNGPTAWSNENIYIQSSAAGTATVIII